MNIWESLIKLYDNYRAEGIPVCPIGHTYITPHIAVLIDKEGNFLCAMQPDVSEMIAVPCTKESESRTSGIAPHLLHDNLIYVANYPGKKERHKKYMEQLEDYVKKNHDDLYAIAIYKYVSKGTVMDDVVDCMPKDLQIPAEKVNIFFGVYGMENEGIDLMWTDYYTSNLPKNGTCCITGKSDNIPTAYPAKTLSISGMERLFLDGAQVGYVASQKIIHMLQFFIYANKNRKKTEAEYNIAHFIKGEITEDDLRKWVESEYPGKWEGFKERLDDGRK